MGTFRDLRAWQLGIDFAEAIYIATETWPDMERYGMTSQIRRAAVSIPANIAEGRGRWGSREFKHYVSIAMGSLCEVQTYLELARRRRYLDIQTSDALESQSEELGKVVWGLMRSLGDK